MTKEGLLIPRETSKTAEGLLELPPQVILVFDFGSTGEEKTKKHLAQLTGNVAGSIGGKETNDVMDLRAAVASLIYHSTLYKDGNRPKVCCFAGAHKQGGTAGSAEVKEHLIGFGINEDDIITTETTITTTTDIMQLHSLMKQLRMTSAAIVTTDEHILRTEQERINHFNAHIEAHGADYKIPTIYVVGPSSPELKELQYDKTEQETMEKIVQPRIEELKSQVTPGGLTEKIAYLLSRFPWLKKYVQPLAERISHPYTPTKLKIIKQLAGMRI
jgi:uncharacterized SAM-binding protein YcdF (DUF218 family)